MQPHNTIIAFALFACSVLGQRHPHFNDGGTLAWSTTFGEAMAAAKQADKLIFVEYGRKTCHTCRSLAERALPDPRIKPLLSAAAVGLAADCDAAEPGVAQLFTSNMPGARSLPFVAFLTPDGRWIDGYSGWKEEAELLEVILRAEKSPLLNAEPAIRKQLEKAAAAAAGATEKGNWKPVLDAAREATKTVGRCPERTAIKTALQSARAWAEKELGSAADEARTQLDLVEPRKRLAQVKKHFAGEPEAADADAGTKAMQRLTQIREAEKLPNPKKNLREVAAEQFKNSRWSAIFTKPEVVLR
jgi:hypothetical protein